MDGWFCFHGFYLFLLFDMCTGVVHALGFEGRIHGTQAQTAHPRDLYDPRSSKVISCPIYYIVSGLVA